MATPKQIVHEGKLYYSLAEAARLLGTTTGKLKEIIGPEGIEYRNFRVNGRMWVSALDLANYLRRREHRT
jgi:hypothetical protein